MFDIIEKSFENQVQDLQDPAEQSAGSCDWVNS